MRSARALPWDGVVGALALGALLGGGCARASPAGVASSDPTPARATASALPPTGEPSSGVAAPGALVVTSPAFAEHESIPAKHTCDGADASPPLAIAGAPATTKTFALIVVDPDAPDPAAPKVVWTHWVAYDLPATSTSIPEGSGNGSKVGRLGKNDWGTVGYRGPCPPIGQHRYFVRVFALDTVLGDLHEPTLAELRRAMEPHVVATGELVGTYKKGK